MASGNLEAMLDPLLAGANLVVGVRTNRHEIYTVPRRIVSYFFNKLPRLLFGIAIYDAGSVKLGNRAIFQFELVSRSPFSEAERLIKAVRLGYRVVFVPIRSIPRVAGKGHGSSWKNIRASVLDMFRCLRVYPIR